MNQVSQARFATILLVSLMAITAIAVAIFTFARPYLHSWSTVPAFAFIVVAGPIAGFAIAKLTRAERDQHHHEDSERRQ